MDSEYQIGGGSARTSKPWLWLVVLVVAILLLCAGVYWFLSRPSMPLAETVTPTEPTAQQKPSLAVQLTGISNGQEVTQALTIGVEVNELSRVSRVEYFVDSVFEAVVYASPFSFVLNPSSLAAGEHTLMAKVHDHDGASFGTGTVTFRVPQSVASNGDSSGRGSADGSGGTTDDGTVTPSTSNGSSSNGSGNGSGGSGNGSGGVDDDDDDDSGGGISNGGSGADTTAPSAPASLALSASDGYTAVLGWNSSSDNVGVTSYKVYRDDVQIGTSTSTSYQDQTVVPGNTYSYSVAAADLAGNTSGESNEPSITLVPTSVWIAADSPQSFADDAGSLELGVKVRPLVNGKMSGVRFYKNPSDAGIHTANLWTSGGVLLASEAFTGETASGWQQASFDTPVDVTAGTTYIVSYSSSNATFSFSANYFATEGITSQYLTAMASGVDGNNGVFAASAGSFPNSSFNNNNYWVDATFIPNTAAGGPTATAEDNSEVNPGYPGSNNTGVPVGKRLPTRDREVVIYEDDAIMENIDVTGQITIRADDVTIRNSNVSGFVYLDTDDAASATWYVTIEDSEINSGSNERAAVSLGQFTLLRANMRGGHIGGLCGGDCSVTDSWLHDQFLPPDDDWHLGGFLSSGGSNIVLDHNTIQCDPENNAFGGGCTGSLNFIADFAAVENVTINNNFLKANEDAGYCLLAGYNAGKPFGLATNNVDITNNIFERGTTGTCGAFGVATDYSIAGTPAPGNSWVNNRYDDGTAIAAP